MEARGEIHVSGNLGRVELNAPCLQQFIQRRIRVEVRHHRILRVLALVHDRLAIQERDQTAATQDELVDGVLCFIADLLGMRDHEHFDVVINFVHVHLELADGEVALQFADDNPWILRLLPHARHHRVHRVAEHRQRGHDADHGLVWRNHARDRARDVIFEESFALR